MNLPDDCVLAYYVDDEAWYASVLRQHGPMPYEQPSIAICAQSTGGGVAWEFVVTEHELSGTTIKLSMFADAFPAISQIPEFFAFLVDQAPTTLAVVREFLDSLGARDITNRRTGVR